MRKNCTSCGIEKDYSEYHKRAHNKSGIMGECKSCTNDRAKKYHAINKETQHARSKEWKENNKEKVVKYMAIWREENADHIKAYQQENKERAYAVSKVWKAENRDRLLEQRRARYAANKERDKIRRDAWIAANPEKGKDALRRWRTANPDKFKAQSKRANVKRASNPMFRFNDRVSGSIRGSLIKGAKGRRHWETLVGFTVDQLRNHIEKLFTPEMTWENYGSYWELDHKIPVAAFNFQHPEDIDFRICWSIKNLQPLEKIQNRMKSDKIDKPFQPSLALAVN